MIDLAGIWTLADAEGEHSLPAAVPGDVHSVLHAAGHIPDPYAGRNEYGARWVADRDRTFTRTFTLPRGEGPWTLVADLIDTVAEIRINGHFVIAHATMFRDLRSATRAADAGRAAQPYFVPWSTTNCPIPNGNMLRKRQCDFGWDWNIALAPAGLYGRIGIVGPEGEIAEVTIEQRHRADRVVLTVRVLLPDANWWPSSPSPGPLSFGDTWHDDSSGDKHFWSVWLEGRDFEHYRDVRPRFCSEFASIDVIPTCAATEDRNIASPVIESHQKNAGGYARIAETMFRYLRFPEGFENFVWLSQVRRWRSLSRSRPTGRGGSRRTRSRSFPAIRPRSSSLRRTATPPPSASPRATSGRARKHPTEGRNDD